MRNLPGTGQSRRTAAGSAKYGELVYSQRIGERGHIVWIVSNGTSGRVEVREPIARPVRRNQTEPRPKGGAGHETVEKPGVGIAVEEHDRFPGGVTVFRISELPAI
jgi:hypothetical protein